MAFYVNKHLVSCLLELCQILTCVLKFPDSFLFLQAKMGYKAGTGLGKHEQGRTNIVEASLQRGRRGLGLNLKGLEPSMDVEWKEEDDKVRFRCRCFQIVTW